MVILFSLNFTSFHQVEISVDIFIDFLLKIRLSNFELQEEKFALGEFVFNNGDFSPEVSFFIFVILHPIKKMMKWQHVN